MNYTLCVPHFCVKLKKMKQKQKRWQKHYREDKKQYVGGILITSFKLPVLSCSQLLKITGFKNTIYNVLALDRCSTCVTVLIYETKMVTVNYVFLCAFFFFFKAGEKVVGTRQQLMLVSEKNFLVFFFWFFLFCFFLVEYNGNETMFPKKEKKWKKCQKKEKKMKKYMNIFFFLSNTFQCDLW